MMSAQSLFITSLYSVSLVCFSLSRFYMPLVCYSLACYGWLHTWFPCPSLVNGNTGSCFRSQNLNPVSRASGKMNMKKPPPVYFVRIIAVLVLLFL